MTEPIVLSYHTPRGTIYYTHNRNPEEPQAPRLPIPPCRPRQRRPHSIHITRLPAGFVPFDLRPAPPPKEPKKQSRFSVELRKLASRENAKRVFGSVFSGFTSNSSSASSSAEASPTVLSPATTSSLRASIGAASSDPNTIFARRAAAASPAPEPPMSRPSLTGSPHRVSPKNSVSHGASWLPTKTPEPEKPVDSANGISISILLSEPVIFLTGLDHDGSNRASGSNSTAILRGKLQLNVTKSAKIKSVTLKFTGRGRVDWPEGIPPTKSEFFEEESFRTQVLPFFNAAFDGSENGYGAYCIYRLRDNKSASSSVTNLPNGSNTTLDVPTTSHQNSIFSIPGLGNRSNRSSVVSSKEQKRLSLQSNHARSFTKGESPFGPTPQQKGYKLFHPGTYEYSFEVPINNNSPETTKLPLASVVWGLEAIVERAGTFKANLQGWKEVPVVRSPAEDSLELVEPISITRKWEDQLYYEIMISGKSFPLGSQIPIAFKLTPLAKVQVHKLKVFLSEGIEYHSRAKSCTRKDHVRKLLLMEKVAGKPIAKEFLPSTVRVVRGGEPDEETREFNRNRASQRRIREAHRTGGQPMPLPEPADNILGDIDLGIEELLGQTEIEMNVQLPTCEMVEKDRTRRLTHDSTWKNVDVHHWIKIVMRISRLDPDDPTGKKRRHFEISIDSPISLLNCRATQANLALPTYTAPNSNTQGQMFVCGCPNAAQLNNFSPVASDSSSGSVPTLESLNGEALPELPRPPQAHLSTNATAGVQRPIHMLRNPSFNPPPFDAEEPPPPIATPPPLYDNVIGTPSHDGLADYFARLAEHDDELTDEEEDMARPSNRGRVNVVNPRTPGGRIARSMDIDRSFMTTPTGSRPNSALNEEYTNGSNQS